MSGDPSRGRFERATIESEALRGNPLGDPHERPLWVYRPPGYEESDRRYPAVYVIPGMTGMVEAWFNVSPFADNFPRMVEELAPQCLVVLVDAFTALGGSQFVDSPAIGRYHTYLCDEVVPFVDGRDRTLAGDAVFECCYQREFPDAARALRNGYGGSWERFLEDFRSGRQVLTGPSDHVLLNTYAMAACYSANDAG